MAAEGHSPLAQFEIKTLVPLQLGETNVSFTNSALFMALTIILVTVFLVLGMRKRALVPGRWQSMAELSYEFVANLLRDTVGNEGRRYFPFVFTLFMFILFGNMLGMLPYSFTFASHIIVTFALAIVVFLGVTILGFVKHGLHFFSFFVPPGVSVVLWPLMIPIEIISYLSRPISLSVRLFANLTAGHTMLKVFAGFIVSMGVIGGVLPFAFVVALTGLELLIAFLQASHIIVTFALAIVVFLGVTILGFVKHGLHFFSFFVPPGVSVVLWPLMIPIEIISYLSRPISLSVRLFANLTAGHTMLKVFAGFIVSMGVIGGVLPFAFVVALTGLELLIAFLQAYVFTILTCFYINDALHLH